jgi:hypothetical protein
MGDLKKTAIANVASKKFGAFQAQLRSFGTTPADELRLDMDPSASAVDGKLGAIAKLKKCMISWYPQTEAPKQVTFFKDVKKAQEVLYQLILMVNIEGYPEQRCYIKGATVKTLGVDPRNGEQVVTFAMTSAGPKP